MRFFSRFTWPPGPGRTVLFHETGRSASCSYVYNASGQRVEKTTASGSVYYLYDLAGHVVTEINSSGSWDRTEVYAAGHHIATYSGGTSGSTYFDSTDWIGTERVRSSASGAVAETCQSLPYGDGLSCSGADVSPLHFTGKQHDSETGLDYFGARYDASSLGRFMTPDWSAKVEPVPYAKLGDPQSLNLYIYVRDNPLSVVDPDGHCAAGGHAVPENHGAGTCDNSQKNSNAANGEKNQTQQQKTDTVTVEEVKGQGVNFFNHEAISVDGKQAVGLEQKKDCGTCAVEGKTTPGAVRPVDPKRKVLEKVTIHITRGQAGRIQTFLDKAAKSPPNYNLYHSNCAEFCAAALGAGGVKAPRDVTPGGLIDDLRKLYPQP